MADFLINRISPLLPAWLNGGMALVLSGCLLAGAAWYVVPHPVIALVFGLLPWGALIALQFPFLMVLAFVIFSFFRVHEVFPILNPLRLPQLLALASLGSLAANYLMGRLVIHWSRELTLFSVLFCLLTVGLMFSSNRAISIEHYSGTFIKIGIMTFAIAWLITRPGQLYLSQYILVVVGAVVGMVAIYNKINGIGIVEHTRVTIGRDMGSMLGDPNDLALVLLFPASFALGLVMTPQMGLMSRFFGIVGYGIMIGAILATQSRGGLLGVVAVTGVFAWQRVKSKTLLISMGVMGLAVLFALSGISERAVGGAHEDGLDESSRARLAAWMAAVKMAFDNPLTGVGMMCFRQNYFVYTDWWDGKAYNVHSTWFGILSEAGLLGCSIYVALFLATAKNVYNLVRSSMPAYMPVAQYSPHFHAFAQALWGGLAGFAISGAFLSQAFLWPFYIMLAFAVASRRIADNSL